MLETQNAKTASTSMDHGNYEAVTEQREHTDAGVTSMRSVQYYHSPLPERYEIVLSFAILAHHIS